MKCLTYLFSTAFFGAKTSFEFASGLLCLKRNYLYVSTNLLAGATDFSNVLKGYLL